MIRPHRQEPVPCGECKTTIGQGFFGGRPIETLWTTFCAAHRRRLPPPMKRACPACGREHYCADRLREGLA